MSLPSQLVVSSKSWSIKKGNEHLVIDKMVPLNAPNYVLHCLQKTQDGDSCNASGTPQTNGWDSLNKGWLSLGNKTNLEDEKRLLKVETNLYDLLFLLFLL